MADKIGVLGEASTATVGTTTAYTVPTGKAARGRVMYRGVAGVNSTLDVVVNGITVFGSAALTSGNVSHSTSAAMHNSQSAASIAGGTDATTVAPGPKEYFLSAGDTVQYTIGTAAFSSINMQFVGTEIDV